VAAAEADGIVFIDEIDKIVINHELRYGAPRPRAHHGSACPRAQDMAPWHI